LLAHDYQPVLAHPERMDFTDDEFDRVLGALESRGVWLQGNLRCLTGLEGARSMQRIERLLGERRYHMLATDVHGPDDLGERLAGLAVARERLGEEEVGRLLEQRAAKLLGGVSELAVRP
jgi:tyrosine-protein phosphatase YwqE